MGSAYAATRISLYFLLYIIKTEVSISHCYKFSGVD